MVTLPKTGPRRAATSQVILVAPAHTGSPRMLPSFAHGPVGATAHQFFPLPDGLKHGISGLKNIGPTQKGYVVFGRRVSWLLLTYLFGIGYQKVTNW